jgi:3-oxoacyl-(acyl-carrier-protein) synthase
MTVNIAGMGWVTPLGRGLDDIAKAIEAGTPITEEPLESPKTGSLFASARVPEAIVADATRVPRLRRSSAISHFAIAAAMDAAAQFGGDLSSAPVMFSSSDGGIVYTRRFYADIAASDEATGSPLLFPETVYNAPASHVAAQFGTNGEALTFVGDSTSAIAALRAAWLMLASGEAETSLVVSAEELDWMSGEAYRRWRIGRYFQSSRTGAVLADGAAALVLRANDGDLCIREVHPGETYGDLRGLPSALEKVLRETTRESIPDLIVASGSGTSFDRVEAGVVTSLFPGVRVTHPRKTLGEAQSCSALQQVLFAAQALRSGSAKCALVSVVGFNGQVSAALVTRADEESLARKARP